MSFTAVLNGNMYAAITQSGGFIQFKLQFELKLKLSS